MHCRAVCTGGSRPALPNACCCHCACCCLLLKLAHAVASPVRWASRPTRMCRLLLPGTLTCWYASKNQDDSMLATAKSRPVYTACPATSTRCVRCGAGKPPAGAGAVVGCSPPGSAVDSCCRCCRSGATGAAACAAASVDSSRLPAIPRGAIIAVANCMTHTRTGECAAARVAGLGAR